MQPGWIISIESFMLTTTEFSLTSQLQRKKEKTPGLMRQNSLV